MSDKNIALTPNKLNVFSEEFLEKSKEETRKFIEALQKAAKLTKEHNINFP